MDSRFRKASLLVSSGAGGGGGGGLRRAQAAAIPSSCLEKTSRVTSTHNLYLMTDVATEFLIEFTCKHHSEHGGMYLHRVNL